MDKITFTMYFAPALMCMGLTFIYIAWKKKHQILARMVWLGWFVVLVSFIFFAEVYGVEYGLVLASGFLSVIAWIVIVLNIKRSAGNKKAYLLENKKTGSHKLKTVGICIVAGPLSIVACALLSVASALIFPLERVNQMAISAFSFPLLLGFACYLVCMYQKPIREALILSFISLVSALWIFL